jgi:hypothetical protein
MTDEQQDAPVLSSPRNEMPAPALPAVVVTAEQGLEESIKHTIADLERERDELQATIDLLNRRLRRERDGRRRRRITTRAARWT